MITCPRTSLYSHFREKAIKVRNKEGSVKDEQDSSTVYAGTSVDHLGGW